MLDLFQELAAVLETLNSAKVPYALCGGLAMAAHAFTRATVDIDLLVPPASLSQVLTLLSEMGYLPSSELKLAAGTVTLTRVIKFDKESDDYLVIDLLHATGDLEDVFNQRTIISTGFGAASVLSKPALIKMKRMRNSDQDISDIKNLAGEHDEK